MVPHFSDVLESFNPEASFLCRRRTLSGSVPGGGWLSAGARTVSPLPAPCLSGGAQSETGGRKALPHVGQVVAARGPAGWRVLIAERPIHPTLPEPPRAEGPRSRCWGRRWMTCARWRRRSLVSGMRLDPEFQTTERFAYLKVSRGGLFGWLSSEMFSSQLAKQRII